MKDNLAKIEHSLRRAADAIAANARAYRAAGDTIRDAMNDFASLAALRKMRLADEARRRIQ